MTRPSSSAARLIWAPGETCADLLYATRFAAPDPFLWISAGRCSWLVVSPLEFGRASPLAHPGLRVMTRERAAAELGLPDPKKAATAAIIIAFARLCRRRTWTVPGDFPLALARQLEAKGLRLRPLVPFFPARRRKTAGELVGIRAGVKLAEAGLARSREVLRSSQIRRGALVWDGAPLTAERLRAEIDQAIGQRGGRCGRTIVAPGRQGADPHEAGYGPIRPDEPIVLDIFPRHERSGYYGDLTRTVVKGKAAEVVRRAHAAVRAAQLAAMAQVRPRAPLRNVHLAAAKTIADRGFATDLAANPPRGFIHGTGHGFGLEIHEAPRVADVDGHLAPGDVITVEPGIYDPAWGGVRIEDDVAVTSTGRTLLSHAPYTLEIP